MSRPGDAIASIGTTFANAIGQIPKAVRESEKWKAFEASNKDAKSANEKLLKGAQSILAHLGVDPNTVPKYEIKSDGSVESSAEYMTRMSQFLLPVATSEKLGGIENFKKSMTALGLASTPSVSERVGQLTMAEQLKTQYPTPDVLAQDAARSGFNLNPQGPVQNAPEASVMVPPAGGQAGPPELVPTSSPVKFETPTDYMAKLGPMLAEGLVRGEISRQSASDKMFALAEKAEDRRIKEIDLEKAKIAALKQSAGELSGRMLSAGGKAYKKGTNEEVTRIDPMAAVQSEYDVEGGRFPTYSYSYGNRGGGPGGPGSMTLDQALKQKQALIQKQIAIANGEERADYNGTTYPKATAIGLIQEEIANLDSYVKKHWPEYQVPQETPPPEGMTVNRGGNGGPITTPGGFIIR
jgi:hypothetical protein